MNSKLTTLVSLVCSAGLLNTAFAEPGYFYVGATGGYTSAHSRFDSTVRYINPSAPFLGIPPSSIIPNYLDGGFVGGLIAGYQAQCDSWILAGELTASWENYNDDYTFAFTDVSASQGLPGFAWYGNLRYQRDAAFEFALRFGYELESLMLFFPPVFIPYVRFGVQTSKDTIEATYSGDPLTYRFSTSSSYKRWPYRFVAGAGTEFPILPELSIRFEYNYRSTGQNLETVSTIIDNGVINPSFSTNMNPTLQSGTIALIWYFK